ncbi:hypothetical protein [Paenibacillus sp. PL2-23]|uniref:hypothetical protein n=1 Tax=Paenibacillus sp. PL2-23 TaxID=2100729 RepID=UPI0030FB3F3B
MSIKGWIAIGLLLLVGAGAFTAGPEAAYACSCAMNPGVEEAKENSDAVFKGTVTRRDEPAKWLAWSSSDPVTWEFQVDEVWKGKVASKLSVISSASTASCGFAFEVGQAYVVYAHQRSDSLEVSLCSRTTALSSAGQDLTELGAGSIPPQPPGGIAATQGGLSVWTLILAAAAVIGAILVYRRVRSTSKKSSL